MKKKKKQIIRVLKKILSLTPCFSPAEQKKTLYFQCTSLDTFFSIQRPIPIQRQTFFLQNSVDLFFLHKFSTYQKEEINPCFEDQTGLFEDKKRRKVKVRRDCLTIILLLFGLKNKKDQCFVTKLPQHVVSSTAGLRIESKVIWGFNIIVKKLLRMFTEQ